MNVQMRWIASLPASALHAAWAVFERRAFVDRSLHDAIVAPAKKLCNTIDGFHLKVDRVFPHLVALSAGIPGPLQLAETSLLKVSDAATARQHASRLAEVVRQVITAFQASVPDVLEQLELRSGPIR